MKWCREQLNSFCQGHRQANADRAQYVRSARGPITIVVMTLFSTWWSKNLQKSNFQQILVRGASRNVLRIELIWYQYKLARDYNTNIMVQGDNSGCHHRVLATRQWIGILMWGIKPTFPCVCSPFGLETANDVKVFVQCCHIENLQNSRQSGRKLKIHKSVLNAIKKKIKDTTLAGGWSS